jgi:hypothetical protein
LELLPLINLKLDGIKNSSQRARVAFFISIISACSIGVVLYNDHFAWSRRLLDEGRGFTQWPPPSKSNPARADASPAPAPVPAPISAISLSNEKRMETIKNWEDNTNIKLDLLGIRLGSSDLTFFGSIAMLVVSIYYCLCARRVRYDVRSVIQDIDKSEEELKAYVLAGIRQSMVLTVVAERDAALSSPDTTLSPKLMRLISSVLSFLAYSPAMAITAIILGDVKFAFFRHDVPNRLWILQNMNFEYRFQFIFLDLFAFVLVLFIWYVNRLTNQFHYATGVAIQSLSAPIPKIDRKSDGVAAGKVQQG